MGCVSGKQELLSTKVPRNKQLDTSSEDDTDEEENVIPTGKILIIGSQGCGKSKLMERILFQKYTETEKSENDDKIICFKGKKILCKENGKEWDIVNNFTIKEVVHDSTFDDNFFCRTIRAMVLAYDTSDATSFENIKKMEKIIERIKEYTYYPRVPRILVGLKCDLPERPNSVSKEEIKNWVDKNNKEDKETFKNFNEEGIFMEWISLEVSAKDGTGILELTELIRTSLEKVLQGD